MNVSLPAIVSTLAVLAACGGGSGAPGAAAPAAPMPKATATAVRADGPTLDLFDAQGRVLPSPAARVPAHSAARTRSGLYATPEQLEWQELVAGPSTVVLDIDQMGLSGAALLAQQVRGWRASGADAGLAWFVRGGTEHEAAQLVNQLVDDGVAPVFLVR